jgi:hypothetical protein
MAADRGPSAPVQAVHRPATISCMFVNEQTELALPFGVTSLRLANMINSGSLAGASQAAYQNGLEALLQVGPMGDTIATTKLVRVRFLRPVYYGDVLRVGMRWEATGAAASLFPILDADISVSSSGEQSALTIAGTYRPPLGKLGAALDKAVLSRIAVATIRRLLQQLADALLEPADVADSQADPVGEPVVQPVIRPSEP